MARRESTVTTAVEETKVCPSETAMAEASRVPPRTEVAKLGIDTKSMLTKTYPY
jgi:hypothetical protein